MYVDFLSSSIGIVEIRASERGVSHIVFVEQAPQDVLPNAFTDSAKQQLQEYFNRQRTTFDVLLDPQGTDFQKAVWQRLLAIPFGQAVSYLDIALQINNPKAVRAVGAANGRNPISIVVPCHRVIGSNKALTGYAGGLERNLGC